MDLVSWKPFGEPSSLRREMENLWNRFLGETPIPRIMSQEWLPSVDISETANQLVITVELPGLEPKDVSVSISENMLTIKGEKKKEKEDQDEHYHYLERYYGSFQRSFKIPVNIRGDEIKASFDKGVLTVTLPKTEEAKKKEIEIKVE